MGSQEGDLYCRNIRFFIQEQDVPSGESKDLGALPVHLKLRAFGAEEARQCHSESRLDEPSRWEYLFVELRNETRLYNNLCLGEDIRANSRDDPCSKHRAGHACGLWSRSAITPGGGGVVRPTASLSTTRSTPITDMFAFAVLLHMPVSGFGDMICRVSTMRGRKAEPNHAPHRGRTWQRRSGSVTVARKLHSYTFWGLPRANLASSAVASMVGQRLPRGF